MPLSKNDTVSIKNVFQILSVPFIIYSTFFMLRIKGIQPEAESGLGEFITAVYFLFGSSSAYLLFIMYCLKLLSPSPKRVWPSDKVWWWMLSVFLLLLTFDEIYMIHENVSSALDIKEVFVFLFYAFLLGVLILLNWKNILQKKSFLLLLGFCFFSGVSVVADTLYGEGCLILFGKEVDYEQLCESLAALLLSCAFVPVVFHEIKKAK